MPSKTIPPLTDGDTIGFFKIVGLPYHRVLGNGRRQWYYRVQCRCGVEKDVKWSHLRLGSIVSCGCYNHNQTALRNHKHGFAKRNEVEPLFWRWSIMKQRCNDPNKEHYDCYGGRGIKVCQEWENDYLCFRAWAIANGWEKGLEIDRIDGDGDYCPNNCRWVTKRTNMNNTRGNRFVTAFGETKTISEWTTDPRCRVKYATLYSRLARGKTAEDAIIKPETL